jgi:metal-sulfur cluster biosynthetic enzyme
LVKSFCSGNLDFVLYKLCLLSNIRYEMVQLHIDIEEGQLLKFKAAVKALGYCTMSEYVREKVRQAIKEAEID